MHERTGRILIALGLLLPTLACAGTRARGAAVVAVGAPAASASFAVLPPHHEVVLVRGVTYYVVDGLFYRPGPGGYVLVRAPVGAVVHRLPPHVRVVRVRGKSTYRVGGVYYRYDAKRRAYVVVNP